MTDRRIALVTGANQGVGFQVAKELAAKDHLVFVGSRDLKRGEAAAEKIGHGAIAIQLDVTDEASVWSAAETINWECGRLDLLVNNAAISHTNTGNMTLEERVEAYKASKVPLEEVRSVWETNVFGVLAVYQAMLPLLKKGKDARVINVGSGVGSLTLNTDKSFEYRAYFGPTYSASKAAMNAITVAMMIELESTNIKVNVVSPAFTKTNLNGYRGTESLEDGSREVVRVALYGPNDPSGTYTRWDNQAIPW